MEEENDLEESDFDGSEEQEDEEPPIVLKTMAALTRKPDPAPADDDSATGQTLSGTIKWLTNARLRIGL